MSKPKNVPHCDVDHHPHPSTPGIATHIHKKQLEAALERVADLEAQNRALKAQLGDQAWNRRTPEGDLLIGLANAFDIAHAFAHESGQAGQTDQEGRRGKPQSTEPRGGSRDARKALNALIRDVESRLEKFHNRRENDWRDPRIDFDNKPKVRCWTRNCTHYSRWFENECPGCGKAATKTATTGEEISESQAQAESA